MPGGASGGGSARTGPTGEGAPYGAGGAARAGADSARTRSTLLHAVIVVLALLAPTLTARLRARWPRGGPVLAQLLPLVGLYGGLAFWERRRPAREDWNRPRGDVGADVGHLLLSGPVALGVGQAVAAGVTAAVPAPARRGLRRLWPSRAPLPVRFALGLGLMELGHYWHHRASHEWGPMWRFHAVHHSAPRLYWANATWFHPVDLGLLSAMEQIPLHLLGVDADTRLATAAFASMYGQYQHTNLDVDGGPANLVFSTPDQHRWHHSTVIAEGNTNYGARLSVWDRLFGTYHLPGPFEGEVGVHGRPDYPLGFGAQLAEPFRR